MSEENISSEVVSDSTPSMEASLDSSEVQESEGTLEESGEVETAVEVEESQPEQQMFSLTIDGEDLELTYDQMVEFAQKGKSSTKRFQEAAQLRKEVESQKKAIQAALQGKPEDLFKMKIDNGLMTGEDLEKWIIEKAIEIAERPELTPEQQRMMEMEKELEELRKAKEEQEKARKDAEFQAQVEEARENFSRDIMTEIQNGGLEADPFTIQQVASVLQSSIDHEGRITVSVRDAVEYVKGQERNSYKDYFKSRKLEELEALLGEDILKQIRTKDLEKIKNPAAPKPASSVEKIMSKKSDTPSKISASEFFKNL